MTYPVAVIDTNVLVAALLTGTVDSPTVKILDGMLRGAFRFLLSTDLLAEYREVPLRKKISTVHGLSEKEVDVLLTALAIHAIVREPETRTGAPDAKDNHLWSLLDSEKNSILVTGDLALTRKPPAKSPVISPRESLTLIA